MLGALNPTLPSSVSSKKSRALSASYAKRTNLRATSRAPKG